MEVLCGALGIMMLSTKKTEKFEAAGYALSSSEAVTIWLDQKIPMTPVTSVEMDSALQ